MSKERIDLLLVERGLAPSREKAKALVMAGAVLAEEQRIDKPGALVDTKAALRLKHDLPFVSRGGLKLAKGIEVFGLKLAGLVAADIGASTGGFTDCMLQQGVRKVYAIDVGYGQLAWKLRQDERVVNMERTNIRHVTADMLEEAPDFASVDVAFISLVKVLPTVKNILHDEGEILALIKPQFEAGRGKVGKKGVVKEPEIHREVIENILSFSRQLGLNPAGLTFSPVKGPEGNIEYLAYLGARLDAEVTDSMIAATVKNAHETLNAKDKGDNNIA